MHILLVEDDNETASYLMKGLKKVVTSLIGLVTEKKACLWL